MNGFSIANLLQLIFKKPFFISRFYSVWFYLLVSFVMKSTCSPVAQEIKATLFSCFVVPHQIRLMKEDTAKKSNTHNSLRLNFKMYSFHSVPYNTCWGNYPPPPPAQFLLMPMEIIHGPNSNGLSKLLFRIFK